MGENRPRPVVRRAQVAALLQLVLVGLGIAVAPEIQSLLVDLVLIVGLPAAVSLITWLQAKLAEAKVTPIADPKLPDAPTGRYGPPQVRFPEGAESWKGYPSGDEPPGR